MSVTRSNKVPDALLRALLADFERSTTVSGGGLQFDALDFDETFEILPDAFRFRPAVSRRVAIGLLRRALIDCRNAGPIIIDALVDRANALDALPEPCRTSDTRSGPSSARPAWRIIPASGWNGRVCDCARRLPSRHASRRASIS